MSKQLLESVVESLKPTFAEYMADSSYWQRYQSELESVQSMDFDDGSIVNYLNYEMDTRWSNHPEHHACTDLALTLQSLDLAYRGVFKFN